MTNYYNNKLSHEDFVKAWVRVFKSGGQIADIAEELNVPIKRVYHRADRLRRMGVKLPNFRDRELVKDEDVDKLNSLAEL